MSGALPVRRDDAQVPAPLPPDRPAGHAPSCRLRHLLRGQRRLFLCLVLTVLQEMQAVTWHAPTNQEQWLESREHAGLVCRRHWKPPRQPRAGFGGQAGGRIAPADWGGHAAPGDLTVDLKSRSSCTTPAAWGLHTAAHTARHITRRCLLASQQRSRCRGCTCRRLHTETHHAAARRACKALQAPATHRACASVSQQRCMRRARRGGQWSGMGGRYAWWPTRYTTCGQPGGEQYNLMFVMLLYECSGGHLGRPRLAVHACAPHLHGRHALKGRHAGHE